MDRIVIFQGDDSLYPWLTAIENVEFGLRVAGVRGRERQAKAREYLAMVGLRGHEAKFPGELSGGMKQRIQIARALVCHSPILLMDEPFAAVDAQTRSMLQEELSASSGSARAARSSSSRTTSPRRSCSRTASA